MASEEIESKRSYLRHKFVWTEEDIEKYVCSSSYMGVSKFFEIDLRKLMLCLETVQTLIN